MAIMCNECSSDMELIEEMWQCPNCFNILIGADLPADHILIEEGLTLDEALAPPPSRDEPR